MYFVFLEMKDIKVEQSTCLALFLMEVGYGTLIKLS